MLQLFLVLSLLLEEEEDGNGGRRDKKSNGAFGKQCKEDAHRKQETMYLAAAFSSIQFIK